MRLKQAGNRFKRIKEAGIGDPDIVLRQRKSTLESAAADAPEEIQHILEPVARDPLTPAGCVADEAKKLPREAATELLARIQRLNSSLQHSQSFSAQARKNLDTMVKKVSEGLQQRTGE